MIREWFPGRLLEAADVIGSLGRLAPVLRDITLALNAGPIPSVPMALPLAFVSPSLGTLYAVPWSIGADPCQLAIGSLGGESTVDVRIDGSSILLGGGVTTSGGWALLSSSTAFTRRIEPLPGSLLSIELVSGAPSQLSVFLLLRNLGLVEAP